MIRAELYNALRPSYRRRLKKAGVLEEFLYEVERKILGVDYYIYSIEDAKCNFKYSSLIDLCYSCIPLGNYTDLRRMYWDGVADRLRKIR